MPMPVAVAVAVAVPAAVVVVMELLRGRFSRCGESTAAVDEALLLERLLRRRGRPPLPLPPPFLLPLPLPPPPPPPLALRPPLAERAGRCTASTEAAEVAW